MKRQWISSGSTFEEQIGYSRAVVVGDWVFVSGTTGFDYATMTISDDVTTQAEQCLQNIATALAQAGCTLDDVVRVNYVLPNGNDFEDRPNCWFPYNPTQKGLNRLSSTKINEVNKAWNGGLLQEFYLNDAEFWIRKTIRKVMMVVEVLMISCQVSL
jgi:enamine deaminase RidA (YjgF/YER057c/UK114 family)